MKSTRLTAILVSIAAVLALLAGSPAMAASSKPYKDTPFAHPTPENPPDPAPARETYEDDDGIIYYNVHSSNIASKERFYEDLISTPHESLGGLSIGDYWLLLALGLTDSSPFVGDSISTAKNMILNHQTSVGKGLDTYTKTAPYWSNDNGGVVREELNIGRSGTGIWIEFSDFSVIKIMPSNEGNAYTSSVIEVPTQYDDMASSTVVNNTALNTNHSLTYSDKNSVSTSSTINHSSSHSYEESISIGTEVDVGAIFAKTKISTELGFKASQAFSDGWSNTSEDTYSIQYLSASASLHGRQAEDRHYRCRRNNTLQLPSSIEVQG